MIDFKHMVLLVEEISITRLRASRDEGNDGSYLGATTMTNNSFDHHISLYVLFPTTYHFGIINTALYY
jgi:hypothetical protein